MTRIVRLPDKLGQVDNGLRFTVQDIPFTEKANDSKIEENADRQNARCSRFPRAGISRSSGWFE